jgi:hypothetical protein
LITKSALDSELALKSPIIHSHTVSDVSGLQNELNGKALIVHDHSIQDVSGLSAELDAKANTTTVNTLLAGKSDINHTHTSFTQLSVGILNSTQEINGLQINSDGGTFSLLETGGLRITGPSSSPVFNSYSVVEKIGTALDPITYPQPVNVVYPYEIPIQINGVVYLIPARESNF